MTNRQFTKGIVACLALMVAFSGVIFLLNHGNSRAEGVAENWLEAIGDTTRKGVEADATRRADEIGAPELAIHVLHPQPEEIDRKAGFANLEVGKSQRVDEDNPDKVKVGFHVSARRPEDETVDIEGVITLEKIDDEWHVVALQRTDPVKAGVPALPSDGGPPPSSAPVSLWFGALVGALLVGAVTSALVRSAGRTTAAVAAA